MKFSMVFLVFLGSVVASSCAPVASFSVQKPPPIIVQINNNRAEITTPGSAKCKPQNRVKPGCVFFDHNETGEMTFQGPASWEFKTLQICKLNADGSKTCSFDDWDRMQFAASNTQKDELLLPDDNGLFDLTKLTSIQSKFLLLNLNTVDQEYYYKVELCKGAGNCKWADPPIENKGRN